MKYKTLPEFENDYKKLSNSDKAKFHEVLKFFIQTCQLLEHDPRSHTWPKSLRFEKLKGTQGICAITWSFSGPDGRATFYFESDGQDQIVVWRNQPKHS